GPSSPRQRERETLAQLAQKTLGKIPALNGRVEKATRLVLAGDVELHADNTALVSSLSDPTKTYMVSPGLCQCRDYLQAPERLCCHRLAVGFSRKIAEILATDPTAVETPSPSEHVALPEAPASLNFQCQIGAFQVQLTLRDTDEGRLLDRLGALLKARRDIAPVPVKQPAPRKPYGGQQGQGRINRDYRR